MNKNIVLLLALLLSVATAGWSQKFGYCNSSALLSEIPEVKAADSELQSFQKQLTKKGQEMVKSLQDRGAELERKKELGTVSPKDYETQSTALQAEQQKIAAYEQEVYQQLSEKRELYFKPILDKVNMAMQEVAKENGYMFVFDSGNQVLLYADESLDVTPLVKKKLGM
jgi:outer membrane protein